MSVPAPSPQPSSPPSPPADVDPAALVDLATGVARRAGRLLLDGLAQARTSIETKSSATDMVSEMDRAAEQLIVSSLLGARPDDGIVGEEGADVAGTSGLRWVVDPLDGTTNYLYGLPGWAVSIAAEGPDGVVAGVVFDPVHDELFTALRGGGAQRNGEPIAASGCRDLGLALVATGFGYRPDRRLGQARVLAELIGDIRDIRRMGAAAVDLCAVACGRVDAFFERGLSWWDLAAGGLVATEAGAVVTSLDGGPVEAGSVLAAAPGIAASLSDRLFALRAGSVP
jgi:myo-inositol-1(or 4)-monophosphatase